MTDVSSIIHLSEGVAPVVGGSSSSFKDHSEPLSAISIVLQASLRRIEFRENASDNLCIDRTFVHETVDG